jgi:nitrate/nitrite transporter NarK
VDARAEICRPSTGAGVWSWSAALAPSADTSRRWYILLSEQPIVPLSLLMVGSTAVISILLPYAAENYPIRVRGRATGWVAGWSKIGGLIAQGLGALALVPALGSAAAIVALPAMMALVLIAVAGHETPCADCRRWARDTWPGSSRT